MKRALPIENSRRIFFAIGFCVFVSCSFLIQAQENPSSVTSKNAPEGNFGQLLEFLDGSALHGRLHSIDSSKGLKWEHPDAKQPIDFKPENIAVIRFPIVNESSATNSEPTCQFHFNNGDEFYGKLVALDENELELQTWFGGKFKTSRAAMRSMRFFQKGLATIYEGPTSLAGWHIGRTPNPQAWRYEDGALIADSVGSIGRNLNLPDASRVEFDLAWSAPFNVLFSFYTANIESFSYSSGSYVFYITQGNVSLQRISSVSGSTTLGHSEAIASMLTKTKAHFEFRGNKEENTLEMLVDDKPINQWKDPAGWVAKGSGILFFAQNEDAVRISNIKVSGWDGKPGSEIATNTPSGSDQIFLANRDKVSGKVEILHEGNLRFKTSAATLEIPLQRITQIIFGDVGTNTVQRAPWEIQASVSGGGKISFTLENWNGEKVSGQNKNFGRISLNSKSIREIQFNLDQPRFRDLGMTSADDIIWENNEK